MLLSAKIIIRDPCRKNYRGEGKTKDSSFLK